MTTALIIVLAAFAAVLLIVAMQPAEFRIVRSTTIAASPEKVFPEVNDFHNWKAWSPWAKIDPAMRESYDGAPAGTGASYYHIRAGEEVLPRDADWHQIMAPDITKEKILQTV